MKTIEQYQTDELKIVYRVLHQNIQLQPKLMDSDLLDDLQQYLQHKAAQDGVDISIHAQWSNWLNNGVNLSSI